MTKSLRWCWSAEEQKGADALSLSLSIFTGGVKGEEGRDHREWDAPGGGGEREITGRRLNRVSRASPDEREEG